MDPLRRSPSPCSSRPSSPRTPPCEMLGYVGIEAVLDQLKIKAMKMGFEFNIMVVGQSGLGKSTMVNTLFKSKIWNCTPLDLGQGPVPQTLQLHSVTHVIEEKGVKLKLTVTDTPGFGDQINNDKCWDPILGYINGQYEQYLQEEILITRQHLVNGRCVLGRKTKWGIIEVENMAHCEFPLLRDLLIRSHLQDLKDITHNVHYENYRVCRLNQSHMLPRGPGWVNLGPTSASPPATHAPSKVRRRTHDNSTEGF
uniref:Septin-type G domain-containing protein n=1 Tax=Molossus molossus TaxID=27622 RepID=A0A7J8J398_MOLMO|nr:hypothetical protein HJG59_016291 [Molossus molossus]